MTLRVGIWGVYGRGNYGNEAALAAFLAQLDPAVYTPVLLTEAPEEAAALHDVAALSLGVAFAGSGGRVARLLRMLANRWAYLAAARRAAADLDAIVIAGSGGLERYGAGAFGTPFEVWSLAMASRLRRRPFVLLDIGVEYLPRRLARAFARGAIRAASYRSYRDEASRENASRMTAPRSAGELVVTDMVFSLAPRLSVRDPERVVVGVMDYWGRDSRADATAAHESYLSRTAALVEHLVERGRRVVLLGGADGDLEMARLVAERLPHLVLPIHDVSTTEDLTEVLSSAPVVIATRYHTLIMALLSGTPTVSIGYGEKHPAMLEQFGLPVTHIDTEEFDPAEVAGLAIREADGFAETSPRILAAVSDARARLEAQWPGVHAAMRRRGAER